MHTGTLTNPMTAIFKIPKGSLIRKRASVLFDTFGFLAFIIFIGWLLFRSGESLSYRWEWFRVPGYLFHLENGRLTLGPLLKGLIVTFQITAISLVLTILIGLITALARLSNSFTARLTARIYVELIRNTPLLVQIFFIYFVIAPVVGMGRFPAAVWSLSLFEGAYASEIFRAGIVSIHRGQMEAAASLGLNSFQAYAHVVLPQALRRVLPPLTGQAISLIKDSALVSTIAIYDLTMAGRAIISDTFLTFEIWFTVAAIYLAVTVTLSITVSLMETRLKART